MVLKHGPVHGWYAFCESVFHTPRGVSLRLGAERSNGSIVERVLFDERPLGLETFKLWKVGVVENNVEYRWPPEQYTPSCTLAKSVVALALLSKKGLPDEQFVSAAYERVISTITTQRTVFAVPTREEFVNAVSDDPSLAMTVRFLCSRCLVAVCLNRQAPFYDSKIFKRVLRQAWKVAPQ
ncbi:MAG: hypothetical protein ACTSVD_03775 [Candidatus Thorarchaeota archaeon]|nr:MAG: hypothetical protein DRO93_08120 [Candidatus Thorarchaeota archaeon]